MRVFRDTWRRERQDRPAAARLTIFGMSALLAGAALAGGGVVLLAQLVAGLALVPLTVATYLRLLPPSPWNDGRGGGGPGRGGDGPGGVGPTGGPDANWESFERQFREYAERREMVPA
jgi:hypothetical protein